MKTTIKTSLLLAAAIGLTFATPLLAKDYNNGGVTGDEIANDLKSIGHKVSVGKDSTGDPKVMASFAVGDTDINYQVYFFGCKSDRCNAIQYHVAFDGDISKVDEWNKTRRFARAYASDATTIHLEYDVDVEKGANTVAIQNSAERFKAVVVQGVTFLGK
ncbi:MAG TPA: YbjN domain-containing protein [Asticcacaulis sp.]|uniref:YbjN domain-containing protein n=1 Tax=Asticcacaulis sp. TaxID=1872648 RepID=UPI002C4CC1AB|nr:YbjN domain-containing protein [Asticcacaulis sp.]HTM80129.1 YbjN domain-containing protein [Asticcacaulis sp.]HTN40707.1 YbjN domain-containing protein [Asticcacaulis sp.]